MRILQESVLSVYLLFLTMYKIIKNRQGEETWCTLFAYDIVVVSESLEKMNLAFER